MISYNNMSSTPRLSKRKISAALAVEEVTSNDSDVVFVEGTNISLVKQIAIKTRSEINSLSSYILEMIEKLTQLIQEQHV